LDLALLLQLYDRLGDHTVIDAGAKLGGFVEALLEIGCARVYAVEPYPANTRHLRERFAGDDRVRVLDVALGSRDGTRELCIAEVHAGRDYADSRSLDAFPGTPEIHGAKQVRVTCRSIGSLVEDGTLPAEVGILKIDSEGYDLEVVRGMGRLSAAVVMVAYWDSLPATGACPYSLQEIGDALAARGYVHALVARCHDGFRVLQLDSLATRRGDRGNAIFVHDGVYPQLAPLLRQAVVEAQTRLLDSARELRRQAQRRTEIIAELRLYRDQSLLPTRLGRWLRPRLGYLRHHPPRPLEIPDRYRTEPPVAGAPPISIVTATLNADQFLERTIRSVLDQGYRPLEYVVQDGGSTDGTPGILDLYRDRLAAVQVEQDGGQADALNRGFARTTGEIMGYLNGDDLLLPGTLRYVGSYFATHPDVDVVYGHRVLIDENDEEIGRWVLPRHAAAVLAWADYVPQETLFWRRRIWERAGGRIDDTFHFAMDWELLLRFRASGARFVRLPRFLGAFRVHEDQKTSTRIANLGLKEMARLREQQHGRPVTSAEVRRHVWGYLLRHMAYQKLYRLGALHY
jgi:FkbM family methyltransferase